MSQEEQPRELWHVKCAASAFDDLDAAAEDLYVLRETAKTPASRAYCEPRPRP